MPKERLLTKSRFKIACECPTKLFYVNKASYGNTSLEDSFLKALAEGGFQVGELAKLYHPGGTEVHALDYGTSLAETNDILSRTDAVIYEAALRHENLFVRVDVLQKKSNEIELIEVKAKSFDSSVQDQFYNRTLLKKGTKKLSSTWEPYLLDVAFQCYVARLAFPTSNVQPFLMLADKEAIATVDGLNQNFFISKGEDGRADISTKAGITAKDLGTKILVKVPVRDEVDFIIQNMKFGSRSFAEHVAFLADLYSSDKRMEATLSKECKNCEFRATNEMKNSGLKSGFEECWKTEGGLSDSDLKRPFVFEVWNYRKADELIEEKRFFIDQLAPEDFEPKKKKASKDTDEVKVGLSMSERQWLQVTKTQKNDAKPFIDTEGLASEMAGWKFPLHFIDFETTMAAIPFHEGRHPYEQIAFQFSHHVVTTDGTIEHRSEYINRERGKFPNFDFVRNLKKALENDDGTIFRYAAHENTVLCQIHRQLVESSEPDRDVLCAWIESVTISTGEESESWKGSRAMVDMCDLVKSFYYHPRMGGSNSIKKVLPAVLNDSQFLQARYSQPLYGAKNGVKSKNFSDWTWIVRQPDGSVKDPYKLLPPIFKDVDMDEMERIIKDDSLADGGAAMTAYARMQFGEMSKAEADLVARALLKYCELDTFAMVAIYEYWRSAVSEANPNRRAA